MFSRVYDTLNAFIGQCVSIHMYDHPLSMTRSEVTPSLRTPRETSSIREIAYMDGSIPPVKMKVLQHHSYIPHGTE